MLMQHSKQNVLVATSELNDQDECKKLFQEQVDDPSTTKFILFTVKETAEQRLELLKQAFDQPLHETVVLEMNAELRETPPAPIPSTSRKGTNAIGKCNRINLDSTNLTEVENRADVCIRNEITQFNDMVLCFYSLTDLAIFADNKDELLSFISDVTGTVQRVNAHAHYHVSRDFHEQRYLKGIDDHFDEILKA